MTVRLRPHHLLCMLTYVGKGYSRAFVENYDEIAIRLDAGEAIAITSAPDDICRPVLGEADCHCRNESVARRDEAAARAIGALLRVDVVDGATIALTPADVSALRQAFAAGDLREACAGCQWFDLCGTVAAGGYRGVRIRPSDVPPAACS
jgi:uncharacterized protein